MKKLLVAISFALATTAASAAQPLPQGAGYEVGFSPAGSALAVVLNGIGSARESIHVAAYALTSKPIASALVDAQKRGVKVGVVADKAQNDRQYSAAWYLANHDVPVRLNDRYQAHHDKFMVIDGRHVQTGSFNYTSAAASKNAENALILWNVPPLAAQYDADWQRLWQEGVALTPRY
ncbi:phospholipase D family protein [Burkholderia cepacia]|uniref:phospholipase D family nuclease n=1 Tax=Burkholderia cepacia TaxID=292 RepID=UPI001E32D2D2|nr:phospholipase D family protein [Burkholderia cepacia]